MTPDTGLKITQIARRLGYNRRRFYGWAQISELPPRNRMQPREGSVGVFLDYLRRRWQEGHRNGKRLFDEIQARGYSGAYKTLAKVLAPWRHATAWAEWPEQASGSLVATAEGKAENQAGHLRSKEVTSDPLEPPVRRISPQVAAALLCTPRPQLTEKQRKTVDALKQNCAEFGLMRKLMMGFRSIFKRGSATGNRKKRLHSFREWIRRARASTMPVIKQFVVRLKRDMQAVEAAVTEPWSNGPVEGQVNRLKAIKRQMYGRAGVELLRARLVELPVQRK